MRKSLPAFFLASILLASCAGCVWKISSPIALTLSIENGSGKRLLLSSGSANREELPAGDSIDIPYASDKLQIEIPNENGRTLDYAIDIMEIPGEFIEESTWRPTTDYLYFNLRICEDLRIYCIPKNGLNGRKIESVQPKGFPVQAMETARERQRI